MAKAKTAYVCTDCGAEHNKWQGQCIECGVWNTLSEIVLAPAASAKSSVGAQRSSYAGKAAGAAQITPLTAVAQTAEAVRRRGSAPTLLESSGGLALANARAYAETGVDFLAVGALTHSVTALDVGLDLQEI